MAPHPTARGGHPSASAPRRSPSTERRADDLISVRRSVVELMARIVAGDTPAVFELATRHHTRIAAVLRRHLRAAGVHHIDETELDGLVIDSCHELAAVAAAWRPDGALPWHWATARLRNLVHGWIGVYSDALDDHAFHVADDAVVAASREDSLDATFQRLVDEIPIVGELAAAAEVARVDEAALLCALDYLIHRDQGDPSPSQTLAPRYGLTPVALRQRVSRTRRRLRVVIESDERFAGLVDLPIVA